MAGFWSPLNNQPNFGAGTMLLLTDGSVLCHQDDTSNWYKLTPDVWGSYINGSWSVLAVGPNSPLYFASAVLRDGRVFVAGGEYNAGAQVDLLATEIYDPVANTWANVPSPAGWVHIGDAPCCMLPDGRVLVGSIDDHQTAIYDPVGNAWAAAGNKNNPSSSEETWTLLPDQTVLTANCNGHPQAEKYLIAADQWVVCGPTPHDLVEASSSEIGPALLLPDGRVFAIGATGWTALYTMPLIANQPGTWADGPTFPVVAGQQLIAKDAPGCLLPNGKVLCAVGPVAGCPPINEGYCPPTYFYEFDPGPSTLTAVPNPPNDGDAPYTGRMLLLPTGQVLFTNGSTDVEVYTPDGAPDPAWKPQITSAPAVVGPDSSYTLHGRGLNGLSQAVSYGDDATMATNYPLVRIRNLASNHIVYCRTFNHSTMGVNTGTVIHSTQFHVPANIELGASELCVVANGIVSDCVLVNVSHKIWKELKWEIKEFKELKENIKAEVDLKSITADIVKLKDNEGDPWQRFGGDPAWLRVIRTLIDRSDKVEEMLSGERAFIREEERPKVGEQALQAPGKQQEGAGKPADDRTRRKPPR